MQYRAVMGVSSLPVVRAELHFPWVHSEKCQKRAWKWCILWSFFMFCWPYMHGKCHFCHSHRYTWHSPNSSVHRIECLRDINKDSVQLTLLLPTLLLQLSGSKYHIHGAAACVEAHWLSGSIPISSTCLDSPLRIALLSILGTHTRTHTHPFNGPFSGTTRLGRYQKGQTSLDFNEARDSEWQWHQMAIYKSAPRSRQITTPAPHHSVFYIGRMPFLPPNQQRQSSEGTNVEQCGFKPCRR